MTLEQRVAKLERQNRWLRTGGVVLIAGVAFVFLIAQAGERELPDLIANSLTLKDIDGNVRGAFGPGPNGSFALSLRDKSDNLRGCFGLGQDGPAGLDLFDRDGRKRVAVEVLSMQEDVPVLWFIGEDGVVRAALALSGGMPVLSLHDKDNTTRGAFWVGQDGTPGLDLRDEDGNVTWQAPPKKETPK